MSFDRREQDFKWWSEFDERTMTALPRWAEDDRECEDDHGDTSSWIPVKYEVCGTCDGKGKHVNPSIDSHGLSREDFDEDPDFAEDYFSGFYDVRCAECDGARVAIVVNEDRATAEQVESIHEFFREQAEDRAIRRMECGGY